ncbi:MAG TPA: cation:proton antiporter [Acidimicrobiia bacterium]|nr:cation:proton antiporter [Acidimicrobiia bacterium]
MVLVGLASFAAAETPGGVAAPLDEHEVLVFLIQILLLVGVARLLGALARRLGQPPVVGELLAGVVLGPSLFGVLLPDAHRWVFAAEPVVNSAIFGLAWLGVVFLLVVMGYETDLGIIARFRKVALAVAAGSLLLPMAATGALGFALADRFSGLADPPPWVFAMFFALALSVSALPVVGKILSDLGLLRRNFGQITLAAAMAKDAVGWLILAVLSGVAAGGIELDRVIVSFGGLALFVVLIFTLGRRFMDSMFKYVLSRGSNVTAGVSIAVVAALAGGVVTQALHVEAILGAYLVGLTLARTRHQLPPVRDRLEMITGAFFAPVFFAVSGLRVDITALADAETALWTLAAIVLAVTAKVVGSVISGRMAGVGSGEAVALGTGLSPLGVMGVVVAIIGLNSGIIDEAAYTILLLAAVITSLMAPVMLTWAVGRWDPPPEEADRLERESLRETAEILGASRILLPTRGGLNSVYAAQLVAAVFPDAEVTVFTVEVPEQRGWRRWARPRNGTKSADPDSIVEALGDTPSRVVEKVNPDPAEAIMAESRLGYDLLVVGATRTDERMPILATVVERVLRVTRISTMIVQFPDDDVVPTALPQRVLVPVTASRSSRAAEEFGYSLSLVTGGSAVALHVVDRPDGEGVFFPGDGVDQGLRAADDLLVAATEFGDRLGARVDSEARVAPNAEKEILDFARRGEIDLIVLGTSSRPVTDRPFFGHRVSYMVENSSVPVVVVALPSFRAKS